MGKTRFLKSKVLANGLGYVNAQGEEAEGEALLNVRKRFTRAQVNAGAVVIKGIEGAKIRLVDLALATEGGAPGTEDITIESKQSNSGVALATFAHADLGDNDYAHLFDGDTTLLNEGASLVANDEGADVTIESGGVDTVDNVDIIATYVLEPA